MKVGVIGLGGMGMHHVDDVRKYDFVREVVGFDLKEEARRRAEATGLRTVASLDALLGEKPDAAIVVTPPAAHAGNIRQCFDAGVPVLTEKPITTDAAESRKLVALAAKKKLNFQVGFEIRYNGSFVGMKDIVDRGLIGTPLIMSLIQLSGNHVGGFRKAVHGGIFYEKLCHEIDIFRCVFGEPSRVMAISGPQIFKHYDVPDNVISVLEFPDGRQGHITFLTSRAAQIGGTDDHGDRGHYLQLVLSCTGGSVTYDPWTAKLEVVRYNHRPDNRSELIDSFNPQERYGKSEYNVTDQDRDFLERTRDHKPPRFPASDAQISMEWVERAERSLREHGRWVTKDEPV